MHAAVAPHQRLHVGKAGRLLDDKRDLLVPAECTIRRIVGLLQVDEAVRSDAGAGVAGLGTAAHPFDDAGC